MLIFRGKHGDTYAFEADEVQAYIDELVAFAKRVWKRAGKTRAWRANQQIDAKAYQVAREVDCESLGALLTVSCVRTQADDGSWRYALEPKLKDGVEMRDDDGVVVDLPL